MKRHASPAERLAILRHLLVLEYRRALSQAAPQARLVELEERLTQVDRAMAQAEDW